MGRPRKGSIGQKRPKKSPTDENAPPKRPAQGKSAAPALTVDNPTEPSPPPIERKEVHVEKTCDHGAMGSSKPKRAMLKHEVDVEEEEEEEEKGCFISRLILEVADLAVDEQRRIDFRFQKYAAQAAACVEASRLAGCCNCPEICEAYHSAFKEMESCIDGMTSHTPYSHLSPKYKCGSCGRSVALCGCYVDCACGRSRGKWSWQSDNWGCRCPPKRPSFDWRAFSLSP